MILNLDTKFRPYGNENEITFEQFTFSGGEPHIKITSDLTLVKDVIITHRIKSFNDMGLLLVAVNALKNMDITHIELFIPYFPGARQDRIMTEGESLTVKVYADLINNLELSKITLFDPHSDVTPALLNNCKVIDNFKFIEQVTEKLNDDLLLISPDAGALKKIYKLAEHLEKYEIIECSKTRNIKTRKLSEFKVYADDLKGKDCLIVDDICDGGRTFLGLAKALKEKNAGKLYLAISHGIFSKGITELAKEFEIIFTTDSFQSPIIDESVINYPLSMK